MKDMTVLFRDAIFFTCIANLPVLLAIIPFSKHHVVIRILLSGFRTQAATVRNCRVLGLLRLWVLESIFVLLGFTITYILFSGLTLFVLSVVGSLCHSKIFPFVLIVLCFTLIVPF